MDGRDGGGDAEGQDRGTSRAGGEKDRRDQTGKNVSDAGWRYGHRHGAEHGGLGEISRNGAGGNDHYLATRGGFRQGREFLYGQSAHGKTNHSLYNQGHRCGNVRATFHFSRIPVCGGERVARRSKARGFYGSRGAFSDSQDGHVRKLQRPAEPTGAQHYLGTERKFRGRAYGLSAARRTAGVDRRRAGICTDGFVQS